MQTTDLIIIGAGPGGYETAVRAAKAGLQVVIVERQHLGGTCLNAGCIPTKCLCHSAEELDTVRSLGADSAIDMPQYFQTAVQRKGEVVEKLKSGVAALMKTPGITLVEGEARFTDSHTMAVDTTSDGQCATRAFTAPNIIIATGSTTKFLPIPGAHAEGVVTSTELLNLPALPHRLCIIGGGVIGLEFAAIFRSFGSEVTVIEYCKEILPNFDRDIAKRLRTSLKKRGIDFHTGAAAKEIRELDGSGLTVDFEEKGKTQSAEADIVLMAVGRAANLDSLNLAEVGIEATPRGITVDEHMQTSVPGIYAIGDVNGLCQLAHAASAQGKVALAHILKPEAEACDIRIIPSAVFTVPEVAMVGQTEEQLTEAGIAYQSHKAFYRANGKALSMDAEDGLVKLLTDSDGHILGCHILGAHASDLIHEATLAMRLGATIHDIGDTVHAHPSLSEILLAAAETD